MKASVEDLHAGTPRQRRRAQTQAEILDAALLVMSEQGIAGLNLTEVAGRVGLRQPSLYQYFASREAVYDALFGRGMREHLRVVTAAIDAAPTPGWAAACAAAHATLRFTADQPVLSQLLFRPEVPGFTPSAESYAPSLEVQQRIVGALAAAVERGELHRAAVDERGVRLFVSLVAGVANERSSNQSDLRDEQELHDLLAPALAMYAEYFAASRSRSWSPWPRPSRTAGRRARS